MIKAVFLDYTGTIMQEKSKYAMKMAEDIAANSSIKTFRDVFGIWRETVGRLEETSYADAYKTEDEIVMETLSILEDKYHYSGNRREFLSMAHLLWSKFPAFDDVKGFCEACPLPVYIITNNRAEYVNVFLEDNGLSCAGIVCGDMVKAYKPHRELFLKALEVSGRVGQETIHIGDSVNSDVKGALGVGIMPVLLDRTGNTVSESYTVVHSLAEALPVLVNG